MKIELIGFGAKHSKKLEKGIHLVFPRAAIIQLEGLLSMPRVTISISRRKRLYRATWIMLYIEALVEKEIHISRVSSPLSLVRHFCVRKQHQPKPKK